MNSRIYNTITNRLSTLMPRRCISCKAPNPNLDHPCCDDCYSMLPFQPPYCSRCGQTFGALQDTCGRCIAQPPNYDQCFCPFLYQTPLSDQIRDFKYHERPEFAKPLAQALAREIQANQLDLPELLVPVPLHISRLRHRGYNQSLLLAKKLGAMLDLPVDYKSLIKKHKTAPQAQLTLNQRRRNLHGSFALAHQISAKSVAIVDDVVTTGSTAAEIAKILKRNGVDYVQVWGIAHTL